MAGIKILGLGKAVPKKILSNDEIATFIETNDQWIRSRTGIGNRHVAEDETTHELAIEAAKEALEEGKIESSEIDLIVVATVSADTAMPSTASLVAKAIGADRARCFDLSAACSGFIFASEVVISMMKQKGYRRALVIGAEVLSNRLDWEDRGTCILFGDGAGAIVYELSEEINQIIQIEIGSDPKGAELIGLPIKTEATRFSNNTVKRPVISMMGRQVYAFATTKIPESILEILEHAKCPIEKINWFVLHQANGRIMDCVAQKLGVSKEKFFRNIQEYGNTSAASIPMALYDLKKQLKPGDKIILSGFGAGLTWGSMLIEWNEISLFRD